MVFDLISAKYALFSMKSPKPTKAQLQKQCQLVEAVMAPKHPTRNAAILVTNSEKHID